MAFCILFVERFKAFPVNNKNIENDLHSEESNHLNDL